MKSILMVTSFLLALAFGTAATDAFSQPVLKKDEPTAEERQAAKRMWELAIAAKGGRERLHAVRNLVVSRQFVMTSEGRKFDVSEEQFYVFPDRFFERNHTHDRTGPYSQLTVNVCDLRVPVCWHQSNLREPYSRPDVLKMYPTKSLSSWFYLMETQWEQPEPLKTRTDRVGFTKYDVVQTVVNGMRIDFFLDRKTHLPMRIERYSEGFINERGVGRAVFKFDDYINVNGVMMPQKVISGSHMPEQLTYQINVGYDERIFGRPPRIDLGREAWRLRKQ